MFSFCQNCRRNYLPLVPAHLLSLNCSTTHVSSTQQKLPENLHLLPPTAQLQPSFLSTSVISCKITNENKQKHCSHYLFSILNLQKKENKCSFRRLCFQFTVLFLPEPQHSKAPYLSCEGESRH